ncbi:hypothetical protein L2E82_52906 [Cichorium intybus]|nr:hypothetical protein L2E82_52906 [Cichorium intybus]
MALGATCVQKLDGSRDLQFTPSIAFCYVLHRCVSRDIRCRESVCDSKEATTNMHTANGTKLDASLLICCFPLAHTVPGFVMVPGLKSHGTPNGATTNISRRGASDRAKAHTPDSRL